MHANVIFSTQAKHFENEKAFIIDVHGVVVASPTAITGCVVWFVCFFVSKTESSVVFLSGLVNSLRDCAGNTVCCLVRRPDHITTVFSRPLSSSSSPFSSPAFFLLLLFLCLGVKCSSSNVKTLLFKGTDVSTGEQSEQRQTQTNPEVCRSNTHTHRLLLEVDEVCTQKCVCVCLCEPLQTSIGVVRC